MKHEARQSNGETVAGQAPMLASTRPKYDEYGDRADGKKSIPHAPNRNLLQPPTRVSTPVAKGDPLAHEHTAKPFKRPTATDELERLHKTFFGTTTLEAYDVGVKLGEGTFG